MNISDSRVLQLALEHLESQKRDLDAQIAELTRRQGISPAKRPGRPRKHSLNESEVSSSKPEIKPRKRMSAAHRTAIAEAMKQRWAERKKEVGKVGSSNPSDTDKTKPRLIKANRPQVGA